MGHPHTIADVLDVLDNMRKTKSLDVSMLPYKEILELLLFFQDEYENLQPKDSYDKILKRLPLYKTIDSTYVRLSASSSYAIVPGCIPLAEITELQRHTGCLFLHSDALPSLNLLYSALGVTGAERTVDSFYVEFILPFFNVFNLDSQMKFLTHVKEKVLPISHNRDELLRVLEETCCIPDEQGHLHYAKDFADPRNKVFRVMLAGSPNQFPPSLFHDDKWLDFLILIGLQEDVNKSQFLEFCNEVALANTTSKSNVERSKVLVQYLLTNTHLHTSTLLSSVSTIKFIASEKVEAELLAIHQQYQCREREEPPFVQFRSSVPWKKRHLVWTSAPLLPQWAQPEGNTICCIKKSLRGYLGVQENLTEDSVLKHLKDISRTLAKSAKEGSLPNPDEVKNIMTSIYKFLSTKMTFVSKDVSNKCTKVCKKIGRYLQEVPCVFLEESMVCVKGAQLSFTVPGESVFNPFLYTVPREYGSYQHFLKRLGATEQITPHQLVNILKAIKDQCQEGKMSSECKEKARIAMHILFELIVDNQALAKNTLLSELYLPSVDEHLIKSNQLICKVPPRLVQTVAKLNYNVLLSLDSCGLQRQRETDYLNALPETLRPIPLESLVREELDPSCKNNTCFSSRDGATCNFIKRYIEIMMCNEFREGIVRLIKHQQKSNELTDETMEKCSRLRWINTARFKVKCMSSIKIRLLNKVTGTVVEGTSMEHICYVVKGNDSWTLYVQHEFGGKNIRGILSKCVNEIMDNCLEENYIMMLTDMLTCNLPHDIADVLDSHDIDKDSLDGMMNPSKSRQELELLDEGSGGREGRGESVSSFMPVHYFPEVEGYTSPNHNEADRWMKQSRNDLEAAKYLLDANPPMFNALVCFLSHQIVEKTLKAVLYAKRGLTNAQLHTHSIHQLVNDVSSEIEGTRNVNMLAASVADYYLNTRYPNRQPDGRVPAEEFGVAEAESALKATDELVEILERFIVE